MRYLYWLAGVILVGGLLVGCSKKTEKEAPAPAGGDAATMEQPKSPAAEPAPAGTKEPAAEPAPAPAESKEPTAAVPEPEQPAAPAAEEAKPAEEGAPAVEEAAEEAAKEVADEATAAGEQIAQEAQSQLDKTLEAVKSGKLDDAEEMLADLETKVTTLPDPLPERIAAARTTLNAARAAAKAKSALPQVQPE